MKPRLPGLIRRHLGRGDPAEAMFQGIRWRLTLWYSGVLAAVLLLLGISLYIGMREALIAPVNDQLHDDARGLVSTWQSGSGYPCMPAPPSGFGNRGHLVACYDRAGNVLAASRFAALIPGFLDPALARSALQHGSATSTLDTGGPIGALQIYALRASSSGQTVVIEVGSGVQIGALHTLVTLLLLLGCGGLVIAALGGFLLARRALLPARLAHQRQRAFIADASHELRTPLTILRADAEVLLRGRNRLPPDDTILLEDVVTEARHMAGLADSMLSLARMESGENHLEQEVLDLSEMAAAATRRVTALASEQHVVLRTEITAPILVIGDRLLLDEAVLILLDNAIKYNRPGGAVVVGTRCQGEKAYLTVRDTGIGMAPEHLAHLGERFYRVDKARSREAGGAGLGVSIARGIANRHRGSLRYTSTPGEGTEATLILPLARIREAVSH